MERTAKLTFLFATVYFVQGIGSPSSGIAAQPVLYLLKEQMGLTAADISLNIWPIRRSSVLRGFSGITAGRSGSRF